MNTFVLSLLATSKTVFEELWDYFVENYLEADVMYYNLGMEGNSMVSFPIIIAGLCIGTFFAVVAGMRDNRVIGGYVRKMLEAGNVGRENATTLEELGLSTRSSFAKALRRSVSLRRYVRCVEEEDFFEIEKESEDLKDNDGKKEAEKKEEYKFTGYEHFYIPEEKRIGAELKYIKKSVRWWVLPVIVIVLVVIFFALMLVLPYILSLLDSLVGSWNDGV